MGFPDFYGGAYVFDEGPWGILGGLGLSELAVRLGSYDSYDRRGDVIWASDFSGGIEAWRPNFSGTGGRFFVDTDHPYQGGYCAHLISGAGENHRGYIYLQVTPRLATGIGVEVAVNIEDYVDEYREVHCWYDGSRLWEAALAFDIADKELRYAVAEGGWAVLDTGITFDYSYPTYHLTKLVVDYKEKKYMRAMLNRKQYDLTGEPLYSEASKEKPYILLILEVIGQPDKNGEITLGHVIVTVNEPPS